MSFPTPKFSETFKIDFFDKTKKYTVVLSEEKSGLCKRHIVKYFTQGNLNGIEETQFYKEFLGPWLYIGISTDELIKAAENNNKEKIYVVVGNGHPISMFTDYLSAKDEKDYAIYDGYENVSIYTFKKVGDEYHFDERIE